jgi:hypothetical protein
LIIRTFINKKTVVLIFILSSLLGIGSCEEPDAKYSNINARLVVGIRVDNVRLGMQENDALGILGKPDREYWVDHGVHGPTHIHSYDQGFHKGMSLRFVPVGEDNKLFLDEIYLNLEYTGSTIDSVRMGSSRDWVIFFYGQPNKSSSYLVYTDDYYCIFQNTIQFCYSNDILQGMYFGYYLPLPEKYDSWNPCK